MNTPEYRKASNIFNEYQLIIKSLQQSNPLFDRDDITSQFGFIGDALINEICRLMKWDIDNPRVFGTMFHFMIHMDDGDFETMRLIVEEVSE